LTCLALLQSEKDLVQRFVKIGINEVCVIKWAEEALSSLEKEPTESEILITAIKNFTKEKKAQHSGGYDS
jgi:hypothetical protein